TWLELWPFKTPTKVKYVGHIVSADGVATDPSKVEAVTTWPRPTDLKTLRSFLGFWYRWDQACTDAFESIKHRLTNAPVLAFADPSKPYVLHVDASLAGLGAVLYQEHPEGLRPVAFASRKLSSSERNYPIHQLEFLSLKWAIVEKFHDYLYGARFTVRTDNNPLTYVYVEQLGASPECVPDVYAFPARVQLNTLGQLSRQDLIL
uniref:Reverse transcriptase/retrotransposon-derived protein RNase H-like domain-containing protein n=1 Tax=Salarias fasciatus TaxID=181472 RepID=A0A672J9G5_SALFA